MYKDFTRNTEGEHLPTRYFCNLENRNYVSKFINSFYRKKYKIKQISMTYMYLKKQQQKKHYENIHRSIK